MSKEGHKIKVIGRVNLQYYLIKYCDRHYLLDYSNPRKISNYGPLCLLSGDRELTIYDVEEEKEQYLQNLTFNYFSHRFSIFCLFLFLLALICLLPHLYNDHLNYFWYIYDYVVPFAFLAVFIVVTTITLQIASKKQVDVSDYQEITLELVESDEGVLSPIFKRICLIVGSYFLFWLSSDIGAYASSIVLSIIFGFLYPFFIIFYRFIVCGFSLPDKDSYRRVYKIK
ncbi:hypothetical protein [Bombilactobacillus thymidiniphilus]|uniref:Tandem five-TM protein n=1 Tax=Bombilactobacillus thymidiniphilus TaxID=2923363 RepID=A0ABY4PBX7_9LACO|nr:hypothetical protein [Bombilactobacillus thymidiniphilus]UQS83064.1 hypothetical protein MOO47_04570 [Bombilactobacillus thymidiniphilus]